jgi:hypothetical protein
MNTLHDKQLIEVTLTDVGAGIDLTLLDTYDDAQQTVLRCKEIVILQWHRTPPDDPPYMILELNWCEVQPGALRSLLVQLRYSFSDDVGASMLGAPALPAEEAVWCRFDGPLFHVHLEGAVCAHIICTRLEIETYSTSGACATG